MKKFYILLIALLMVSGVMSQSPQPCSTCLPGGITFATQAQVDSFQTNYPNCTQIEGYVTIHGDDIANLNGLNVLNSIGGGLTIQFNAALTSLTGLDNLTSIAVMLYIGNSFLTSLTGLDNLTSIAGGLHFHNNGALTSLTGLDNLTSIGGGLEINANNALTSLSGLDNIDAGSITNLDIIGNGYLSTCDAQWLCDYLANPNGSIFIYANASGCNSVIDLALDCEDVPCLPYGRYYFTSQADIDSFQYAFPNCTELEGDVIINGSDITNLNGLNAITSIGGGFYFSDNAALTSLMGMNNLTSVGGDLEIRYCYALTNLTGLAGLTSIGGGLYFSDNASLTSLTGLEGLTSIGGHLSIKENDSLTSLTGLENINAGSIAGLNIYRNNLLSTCDVKSICDYLISPNGNIDIQNNATGCDSPQEVTDACNSFSVDELTSENHINIYPNPSSTSITIETPTTPNKNTFMTILNINGQALLSRQITEPTITIDIRDLPSGIYVVKVVGDNEVQVGKFVKN